MEKPLFFLLLLIFILPGYVFGQAFYYPPHASSGVYGLIDPASPPAWGTTTPNTGAFTTLSTTTLTGAKDELVKAATGTITAAEMKGQIINNYGQADDMTLVLDAAFEGANFTVILGTTVAKYFRLDPNASDKIYVDGTADTDGHYLGIASAVAGAAVHVQAFQTGAGAYDWYASVISGAWVAE